jgi:hypothetical protein
MNSARFSRPPRSQLRIHLYTFTMFGVRRILKGLCLVSLLATASAHTARADDGATDLRDSARTYLWLSTSATLLSASLASVYALKIGAIYDEAQSVPGVSPERVILRHNARHAEVTADVFFATTGVLAIGTGFLLWLVLHEHAPRSAAATSGVTPVLSPRAAGLAWRGNLP